MKNQVITKIQLAICLLAMMCLGDFADFQSKALNAVTVRNQLIDRDEQPTWQSELASSTGLPLVFVTEMDKAIQALASLEKSVIEWRDWFFYVLDSNQLLSRVIVSPSNFVEISKAGRRGQERRNEKECNELLRALTKKWVSGATLIELETAMGVKVEKAGFCDLARKCLSKWFRPVTYGIGLIPQILRNRDENVQLPTEITVIASTMKDGFQSFEYLALGHVLDEPHARCEVVQKFNLIKHNLQERFNNETFNKTKHRMDQVHRLTTAQIEFGNLE